MPLCICPLSHRSFMQRGTLPEETIDAHNSHPHIVRFTDAAGDLLPQHFIVIEQGLLVECKNFINCLYIMLAVHFVFNTEYHPKVKDVLFFLQEKVLSISDPTYKKSSPYMNISSAIDLYINE